MLFYVSLLYIMSSNTTLMSLFQLCTTVKGVMDPQTDSSSNFILNMVEELVESKLDDYLEHILDTSEINPLKSSKDIIKEAKEKMKKSKEKVEEKIEEVKGKIEEKVEEVKGQIEEKVEEVKGQIEEKINKIEEVKGQIEEKVKKVEEIEKKVEEKVEEKVEIVKQDVKEIVSAPANTKEAKV